MSELQKSNRRCFSGETVRQIRAIRARRGWTYRQLATKFYCSEGTIKRYCTVYKRAENKKNANLTGSEVRIFMRDRIRKTKENKSIIVRTRKGNTVGCYRFTTYCRDSNNIPAACNKYASFDKAAERIEVNWNVGGDVCINLYEWHPNSFEVKESVVFSKEYVTAIEIETDFDNLR